MWSRMLSQCRCRMPHTFCPVLPSRLHHLLACRTRPNRCRTTPSLIFLVTSLMRRDHIWPSLSSFRSENEITNVVDDGLALFDSCLVRIVQDGLEGVVTRSLFGQLICPLGAPYISSQSRKHSKIRLHTSACGLRAAVHHFGPRSGPRSTVAQSETNVTLGSDKIMACRNAHTSTRKIRRCTGSEIGMAPCAEQTSSVGSLVGLRYCPSSLSTLRSMFAHQESINKQLASKTVADNTRVHPTQVSNRRACVQECTSQQGRASSPLSHLSLSPVAVCP